MAAITYYPISTASAVITAVTAHRLSSSAPGTGSPNTTAQVSPSTDTSNYFQFTPGATNSTGQAALPTNPNGKGWILDSSSGTLQNVLNTFKLRIDNTKGTMNVYVKIWKVTIASNNVDTTDEVLIRDWFTSAYATGVTGLDNLLSNTFTPSVTTLDTGEYLYFEVWGLQTATGGGGSRTWTLETNHNDTAWVTDVNAGIARTTTLTDIINLSPVGYTNLASNNIASAETSTPFNFTNVMTATRDSTHAYHGTYSTKFVANQGSGDCLAQLFNGGSGNVGQAIAIDPNTQYTFSCYVYCTTWPGETLKFYKGQYNSSGTLISNTTDLGFDNNVWNMTPTAGQWVRFVGTFTSESTAEYFSPRIGPRTGLFAYTYWIDGIQLEVGNTANDFALGTVSTPVDTFSFVVTLTKLLTEAITTSDLFSVLVKLVRLEGISVADAFSSRFLILTQLLEDSYTGMSDSLSQSIGILRQETQNLTDALIKHIGGYQQENVSMSDTTSVFALLVRKLFTDVLDMSTDGMFSKVYAIRTDSYNGMSDTLISYFKSKLSETLSSADTIVKKIGAKISDAVSLVATVKNSMKQYLPDGVSVTDIVSQILTFTLTLTDTYAGLADAVYNLMKVKHNESVASEDTKQSVWSGYRTFLENQTITETVLFTFKRTLVDTYSSFTDKIANKVHKSLQDTQAMVDAITYFVLLSLVLTDSLGVSDFLSKQVRQVLSDSTPMDDIFAVGARKVLLLLENIGTADIHLTALMFLRVFTETIATEDFLNKLLTLHRTLTDAIEMTHTIVRKRWYAFTEAITTSDAFLYVAVVFRTFTISRKFRETVSGTLTPKAHILDPIGTYFIEIGQILKNVNKTLTVRNRLAMLVAKTLSPLAHIQQNIYQTFVAVSTVSNKIGRSLKSNSTVLNKVQTSLTYASELFNYAGKSLTTEMRSYELVYTTLSSQANSEMHIGVDFTEQADILNTLQQSFVQKSNVLANTHITLTEAAGIRALVGFNLVTDNGYIFNLVGSDLTTLAKGVEHVGAYFTSQANTRQLTLKTLTPQQNIFEILTQTFTSNNIVLGLVDLRLKQLAHVQQLATKVLLSSSNVYNTRDKSLTTKQNIFHAVTIYLTETSHVLATLGSELLGKSNILNNVGETLTALMTGRQLATKMVTPQAHIYNTLAATFGFVSHILTTAGTLLTTLNGKIDNIVPKAITERARILTILGKNFVGKANILTILTKNFTKRTDVLLNVGKDFTSIASGEGKIVKLVPTFVIINEKVGADFSVRSSVQTPIVRTFVVEVVEEQYAVTPWNDYSISPDDGQVVTLTKSVRISYRVKR